MWSAIKKTLRKCAKACWTNQEGYSLLEIALSLIVLGLLSGGTLALIRSYSEGSRWHKTHINQEKIAQAVGFFLSRKGYIPCPADPRPLGDKRGVARMTCQDRFARGIVPFRTLGLSEKTAKDGFGRWITYVVDPALAMPSGLLSRPSFCQSFFAKVSRLRVIENGSLVDASCGGGPALVLISHGASGSGAYTPTGGRIALEPNASVGKKQNAQDGMCVRADGDGEDRVFFVTRGELVFHYSGIRCGDSFFLPSPSENNLQGYSPLRRDRP